MDLHFSLSRNLHAYDLRFPFRLYWRASAGVHALSVKVALRKDEYGAGWSIPAETLFSVLIEPGVRGCASGTLTIDTFEATVSSLPDWVSLREAFRNDAIPFGQVLAQQMFTVPEHTWNIAETCKVIGMERRALQMRLFREAYEPVRISVGEAVETSTSRAPA